MPRVLVGLVAVALAVAGCGSTSGGRASSTVSTAQRAGPNPSESARMVCAEEAQHDIAASLGATPTRVTTPTWADHVYACDDDYPGAVISLSVKELVDARATTRYFDALGARLGRRPDPFALGDGAFATPGGSVVVRKDYKVLLVDTTRVPDGFGRPAQDRLDVGLSVAAILMACWNGG